MDVEGDNISFGEDFRKRLNEQAAECKVLLAIVGPHWVKDPRLQDEKDFLRIEIEYGLDPERDILVIPVLVSKAPMPPADQLPESLKDFAFRNAIQVRPDPDFHSDMDKLIDTLAHVLGEGLGEQIIPTESYTYRPYKMRGGEFYDPKELAEYLSKHWAEGVKHFREGFITDWVKRECQDQGLTLELTDVADEKLDEDQKLTAVLLLMNEELPMFWKGAEVSADQLENILEQEGISESEFRNRKDIIKELSRASQLQHYYELAHPNDKLKLKKFFGPAEEGSRAEYLPASRATQNELSPEVTTNKSETPNWWRAESVSILSILIVIAMGFGWVYLRENPEQMPRWVIWMLLGISLCLLQVVIAYWYWMAKQPRVDGVLHYMCGSGGMLDLFEFNQKRDMAIDLDKINTDMLRHRIHLKFRGRKMDPDRQISLLTSNFEVNGKPYNAGDFCDVDRRVIIVFGNHKIHYEP